MFSVRVGGRETDAEWMRSATEHSTGDVVAAQLEEATKRTGIPRQVVSDHGSDVKKGSELFAARHPQTAVTYDAAHHGAIVLKKRLEADPRWAALITRLGQTKARLLQTSEAYLCSPSLRSKARFMNLKPVLRWCRAILKLIARGAAGGVASARDPALRLVTKVRRRDSSLVALGVDRERLHRVRTNSRLVGGQ